MSTPQQPTPTKKPAIFRQTSLERLASPEQLDLLIQVTSLRGWLSLWAIAGILVVALLWGFFGSLPNKIGGSCILIRPGGVNEIVAPGNGWISDLSVEAGDTVRHGQMIARIERSDAMEQMKNAEAKLHELKARLGKLQAINAETGAQQSAYFNDAEKNLRTKIAVSEDQSKTLAAKIAAQEQLLEQGLITKQSLLASRLESANVQQSIDSSRNEIRQLGLRRLEGRKQVTDELGSLAIQINEATRNLASLMRSSDQSTLVFSPYAGRVLEVRLSEGNNVSAGIPIVTIEQSGASVSDLEAVVYLSPLDGKKIKPNMDVQIAPSTVRQEEYGLLVGRVKSVSDYPSSAEGMMRLLKNQQLVQRLAADGAPIALRADLTPNAGTTSGYKWTSPKGPNTRIESGTLCSATVIVARQRPIGLLIPLLRESVGI